MKIFLPALLALSFSVAAVAAPAKPNIDARGVAALDKSIAYYKGLKSFAVTATDTITQPGKTQRFRSRLSLQTPLRMSLSVVDLDAPDPAREPQMIGLVGAGSLVISLNRQPATTIALHSEKERADAILNLSQTSPSLVKSVLALAFNTNPARGDFVKSVRFGPIREGSRRLLNVTVVRDYGDDSALATLEYRLAPQTYALQKLVAHRQRAGRNVVIVTELGPALANWKGTQSATDAAVYSLQKLAPAIAQRAPRAGQKVNVMIAPKARAIFARATALYAAEQRLRGAWTTHFGKYDFQVRFDFDRAGLLRLQQPETEDSLLVCDGKNFWRQNTLEKPARFKRETAPGQLTTAVIKELGLAIGGGPLISDGPDIADFINNINALSAQEVSLKMTDEVLEFRATTLPAQVTGGQFCDLVRLTTLGVRQSGAKGLRTEQLTYWFAQSDGRLMRVQERVTDGSSVTTSDSQFTSQDFNPTFAPGTFEFVPPPGAVLSTK